MDSIALKFLYSLYHKDLMKCSSKENRLLTTKQTILLIPEEGEIIFLIHKGVYPSHLM